MKQRFFVTATGTDIGKTFITAGLVRQAKARNIDIAAYKPLISGFDPLNPHTTDTGVLLRSMGLAITPKNIERVSPWRYAAALAPSMAAKLENTTVDFDALIAYIRYSLSGPEDVVLIEGLGGVMAPVNDTKTLLDWIEPLRIKAILITGNYLGSLSHALTALAVLEQRQIQVHSIIVNESVQSTVSLDQTVGDLQHFTKTDIRVVRRRDVEHSQDSIEELDGFFG